MAILPSKEVDTASRRMEIGTSEAESIWTEFLRKLTRRGLRGVKLVVSDAHEGLKAAATKVLSATWQRCRVHFMRNVLAHAGKSGRRVVSAFIGLYRYSNAHLGPSARQARRAADQHHAWALRQVPILKFRQPNLLRTEAALEPGYFGPAHFPSPFQGERSAIPASSPDSHNRRSSTRIRHSPAGLRHLGHRMPIRRARF